MSRTINQSDLLFQRGMSYCRRVDTHGGLRRKESSIFELLSVLTMRNGLRSSIVQFSLNHLDQQSILRAQILFEHGIVGNRLIER